MRVYVSLSEKETVTYVFEGDTIAGAGNNVQTTVVARTYIIFACLTRSTLEWGGLDVQ